MCLTEPANQAGPEPKAQGRQNDGLADGNAAADEAAEPAAVIRGPQRHDQTAGRAEALDQGPAPRVGAAREWRHGEVTCVRERTGLVVALRHVDARARVVADTKSCVQLQADLPE